MPNLNVAVVGSPGYARNLGKKSGETDITFYDYKRGETTLAVVEPSRYPEKLASLSYAAGFGDHAVFVVEKLDQYFGETLLLLDAAGARCGSLILRNFITPDQVARFVKGTAIEGYAVRADDPVRLREDLLTEAEGRRGMVNLDFGTVSVDQAFTVKGIGTVALGVVKAGTVKKHDVLRALPGTGRAEVRSIQKHDDDFETAEPGDRVGVALKGVESDDLPRGTVLTDDSSMTVTQRTDAELTLNAYWAQPPHEGMVVQVGYWMQFNVARVSQAEPLGGRRHRLTLEMERPLVHPKGSSAALTYVDGGKLRVMGAITLP